MLHNSALKTAAGTWDEKSHWLCGDAGQAQFAAAACVKPCRISFVCGWRLRDHASQRCGCDDGLWSLGYLATAAHGHADALSLTLSVGATPVLVDAGTYAYQEGGAWRSFSQHKERIIRLSSPGRIKVKCAAPFFWGSTGRDPDSRLAVNCGVR